MLIRTDTLDYCPYQSNLHQLVKMCRPDEEMAPLLEHCKHWTASEDVDKADREHGVDVVVGCSDSFFQVCRLVDGSSFSIVRMQQRSVHNTPDGWPRASVKHL